MAITISLINMKGGVGKTTLAFNLAWYCVWRENLKVLAIDLDPQANLSQYFMSAEAYLNYIKDNKGTVVEIFEQFSAPTRKTGAPIQISKENIIHQLRYWGNDSLLHLIPSRLELAWTLKNPTEKAQLLPQFLAKVSDEYDLIIIDCAPTESILSTAAYRSSRYVIVPVRPEFLATIGLPLLERSINEHKTRYQDQELEMAGIIFNDGRANPSPEQKKSYKDVKALASEYGWYVFKNEAYHSDSYPRGSRQSTPIFHTSRAKRYVRQDFNKIGKELLERLGIK